MNLVAELERVLKEEQEHLLSGDFSALESLIERKSRLVARLSSGDTGLTKADCESLAKRARHNDALLDSARLGLRAAMKQLQAAADPAEQSTYSKSGERTPILRARSSVIQRI